MLTFARLTSGWLAGPRRLVRRRADGGHARCPVAMDQITLATPFVPSSQLLFVVRVQVTDGLGSPRRWSVQSWTDGWSARIRVNLDTSVPQADEQIEDDAVH